MPANLFVARAGQGAPAIIFVHGLGCDHRDWAAQTRALSSDFQVLALDLPGHGRSAACETSIEALAEMVVRLKREVGGPCVLVGHSLGCAIVLEARRLSPANVTGLVLVDGGHVGEGDPDLAAAAFEQKINAVRFDRFVRAFYSQMVGANGDPALRARVIDRALSVDPLVAKAMMLSVVRWDAAKAADAVSAAPARLLVFQSTYLDEAMRFCSLEPDETNGYIDFVRKHAPHAEIHVAPGVGHFPMIEAAETVSEAVRAFARGAARRA